MRSIAILSVPLLYAAAGVLVAVVDANNNNLSRNSQKVFGWQKKRSATTTHGALPSHGPTAARGNNNNGISLSPLKRSENVFGWQRNTANTKQQQRHHQRRENAKQSHPKAILNTSSSVGSSSSINAYKDDEERQKQTKQTSNSNNLQLTPPKNIKLQPRKKELWLPWPLDNIRNDFHRFADEHNSNHNKNVASGAARQEWHPRKSNSSSQSQQQQQIQNYYSNNYYDTARNNNIFHEGKDWAARMLRRVPLFNHGDSYSQHTDARLGDEASSSSSLSSSSSSTASKKEYWIKDATTSMAAASAIPSLGKKKQKKKQGAAASIASDNNDEDGEHATKNFDKDVMFRYLKLQASVRLRQLGYVGSDLSVHLPPVAPILLFYYFYPSKQDPMRRLVKYTMMGGAISWMHSEATKYRRFSPLPQMRGMNVRQPDLPPFLPEKESWSMLEGLEDATSSSSSSSSSNNNSGGSSKNKKKGGVSRNQAAKDEVKTTNKEEEREPSNENNHNHHHLWDPFQSFGTISSAYRTWLEGYNLRNKRLYQQRRLRAQEQLLALKHMSLTSKASSSNSTNVSMSSSKKKSDSSSSTNTGYALITGASTGIGRALAVELARYQIPLILVARDVKKLGRVAKDIETYYNIPCRILSADLSQRDCASRIHEATTSAGLEVDILVNNAGVCTHGNFLEVGEEDDSGGANDDAIARMIEVNIHSSTQLCRLYGRDMKERRRGRILFVSSMSGVLPGCPSVAVYAATKAFGKSLSMSLGREMERYGVGVTCLLPGAVKDTSFASKSEVEDAVCFHVPGYALSPELVAGVGIKGLMLGYPEIYPGWHNRAFVKMFMPMLPQRVSNIIGEWMWNPWQWGDVMPSRGSNRNRSSRNQWQQVEEEDGRTKASSDLSTTPSRADPATSTSTWKFRRLSPSPPGNEMQLPDRTVDKSSDESSNPMPMTLVDPVNDALPPAEQLNTTIQSGESQTASLDASSQPGIDKKSANGEPDTTPSNSLDAVAADRPQKNKPSSVDKNKDADKRESQRTMQKQEEGERNENESSMAQDVPTPKPLVLPPPATSQQSPNNDSESSSTPLALFGFFDKEEPTSSPQKEPIQSDDAEDAEPESDETVGEESSPDTWYPSMMDKKDYDFRDRRLDY